MGLQNLGADIGTVRSSDPSRSAINAGDWSRCYKRARKTGCALVAPPLDRYVVWTPAGDRRPAHHVHLFCLAVCPHQSFRHGISHGSALLRIAFAEQVHATILLDADGAAPRALTPHVARPLINEGLVPEHPRGERTEQLFGLTANRAR